LQAGGVQHASLLQCSVATARAYAHLLALVRRAAHGDCFQDMLRKLDASAAWPSEAGRACREFLANLCGLSVAWNVAALRPARQPAAAPAARRGAGERLFIVCPLITDTRT
jgi:hypothetical protein